MDVTIVGSINTDLICYTERFPTAGETIEGKQFSTGYGGKGANQCVAAKKLGANVSLISRVGNDHFGESYLKYLTRLGISTDSIKVSESIASGIAIITVQIESGENQIVIIPGANNELSPQDVFDAKKRGFISERVLLCQFESNPHASLYAMEEAKRGNVITILDPAPAPLKNSALYPLIPRFLAASTIICPNETEAAIITGINISISECMTSAEIAESAVPWLISFFHSGVLYSIVTIGKNGVVALIPNCDCSSPMSSDVFHLKSDQLPEDRSIFHIKAPIDNFPVDTTGAGDCFTGSLAFFMSKYPYLSMVEKLRRSVWISSQSVMRCGTQSSFLSREELPKSLFDDKSIFNPPQG